MYNTLQFLFIDIYRGVRLFVPVSCIYVVCDLNIKKKTILFEKWKFYNIFHANTWTVASIAEKNKSNNIQNVLRVISTWNKRIIKRKIDLLIHKNVFFSRVRSYWFASKKTANSFIRIYLYFSHNSLSASIVINNLFCGKTVGQLTYWRRPSVPKLPYTRRVYATDIFRNVRRRSGRFARRKQIAKPINNRTRTPIAFCYCPTSSLFFVATVKPKRTLQKFYSRTSMVVRRIMWLRDGPLGNP